MAKGRKRKIDTRGPLQRALDNDNVQTAQSYLDVITPEMAEKGSYSAKDGGRRYYRTKHLDRLHRASKLTYEQFVAGDWYRTQFDAGRYDSARTADWTRVRGQNVVQFTLPTNAQQARDNWRAARCQIPLHMRGFVDRFLLRDEYPPRHHRASMRRLAELRKALDILARHLRLT